jgi:hypothetical protein
LRQCERKSPAEILIGSVIAFRRHFSGLQFRISIYPLAFIDLRDSGDIIRPLVSRMPLQRAKVRKKKREAAQQGTGKRNTKKTGMRS